MLAALGVAGTDDDFFDLLAGCSGGSFGEEVSDEFVGIFGVSSLGEFSVEVLHGCFFVGTSCCEREGESEREEESSEMHLERLKMDGRW